MISAPSTSIASPPAGSRWPRSAACLAPPPAARSSPTGPTAAATSSSTSPTRRRQRSTRPSSSPRCSAGCRYFHVMGSSLFSAQIAAAVRRGVELARGEGAQISFDPNIRKELLALPDVAATIADVLAVTDVLLPSEADLEHLCPGQDEAQALASLLDAGRSMILLKKGALGSVYRDRQQRIATSAFPARGGRSDRRRRLLRRHVPRLPRPRRADRACLAPRQRGRGAGRGEEGADGGQFDHGRARGVPGAAALSALREQSSRRTGPASAAASARSARPIRSSWKRDRPGGCRRRAGC